LHPKTSKSVTKIIYSKVVYQVTLNDVGWKGRATEQTNQRRVLTHVVPGRTRCKSGTSFILDKQIAPFGTISLGEARNFSFFANYRQGGNNSQINEANKGKQVSTFAVESLKVFSK